AEVFAKGRVETLSRGDRREPLSMFPGQLIELAAHRGMPPMYGGGLGCPSSRFAPDVLRLAGGDAERRRQRSQRGEKVPLRFSRFQAPGELPNVSLSLAREDPLAMLGGEMSEVAGDVGGPAEVIAAVELSQDGFEGHELSATLI